MKMTINMNTEAGVIIINMVQITPHRWQLVSQKGNVIQDNITANSSYEASEYARKYISSFIGWDFKLILLKDTKVIK